MQQHQRKETLEPVEAVCWDGTVDDAFLGWLCNNDYGKPDSDRRVRHSTEPRVTLEFSQVLPAQAGERDARGQRARIVVSPGEWIVKSASHGLTVLSGAAFREQYERDPRDALAHRTCELMVRAMIVGEDPRSVSWSALDEVYENSKRVLGRGRVIEIYREERPEQLDSFLADSSAQECFGPR